MSCIYAWISLDCFFSFSFSFSIILVEIATRCDLISVSILRYSFDAPLSAQIGCCHSGLFMILLQQRQMEMVKLDVVWRPPLPELKAGKSDSDCPNEADYCEVCKL